MKTKINFALVLISLFIFSCDPGKRIARIAKRHPEVVKSDTVKKEISVDIPPIHIDTSFIKDKSDSIALISLIDDLKGQIDSLSAYKLKSGVQYISTHYKSIKDTLSFLKDSLTIKLWERNGKIELRVDKPLTHIKTTVPVAINTITPPVIKHISLVDRIKLWIFNNVIFLLIILVILYLIYRVVKWILSKYFPKAK